MTDERWQEIKGLVKDKFPDVTETAGELSEDDGPGTIETIEFSGPMGKMRLTRTTKPLVLEKKVLGSRRIGSESTVQYKYSASEKIHKFIVYKFDDASGQWQELPIERGEMFF